MGFFSFDCKECGHPMLSGCATSPINNWMRQVVVIEEDGTILQGEYDGYGRVGEVAIAWPMKASCYHSACWTVNGAPSKYAGQSESSEDQGYFFSDADHHMAEPKTRADAE